MADPRPFGVLKYGTSKYSRWPFAAMAGLASYAYMTDASVGATYPLSGHQDYQYTTGARVTKDSPLSGVSVYIYLAHADKVVKEAQFEGNSSYFYDSFAHLTVFASVEFSGAVSYRYDYSARLRVTSNVRGSVSYVYNTIGNPYIGPFWNPDTSPDWPWGGVPDTDPGWQPATGGQPGWSLGGSMTVVWTPIENKEGGWNG